MQITKKIAALVNMLENARGPMLQASEICTAHAHPELALHFIHFGEAVDSIVKRERATGLRREDAYTPITPAARAARNR